WESARDEEAERRVVLARAEAALAEVERRIHAAENARDELRLRSEQMAGEAADLRAHLEDFVGVREGAAGEVQELFALRDQEIGALALLDARLAEVDSELAELGERTRVSRRRETEAAEERHRLDLLLSELRSRVERVRERLEVEWGRPWNTLLAEAAEVEGSPEEWRRELRETT